jgi:hypothetical protein
MNLEELFEDIYNAGNLATETENTYLESPLDTELKPPMLMEEIYFECNLKPLFEQVLREMADTIPAKFARALRNAYLKLKSVSFKEIVKEAITYIRGGVIDKNDPKTKLHLLDTNGKEVIIKADTYNNSFKNAKSYADTVLAAYENPKNKIEPRFYTEKQKPELQQEITSEILREYEIFTPENEEYNKLEKLGGTNHNVV